MQLQFETGNTRCMQKVKSEVLTQEQTQELRLPDGMPDVGRVLSAWAQVLIRGKEWQSDTVGVSCGVMVWVLYAPEDGSQAQCVETWIPMTFKWDIPQTDVDGNILCHGLVRSVDARTVSGRKLMVRATASVMAQVWLPEQLTLYTPAGLPEDIQLLQKQEPISMAAEAGEKAFMLDEELSVPTSAPEMEKLIRYSLQPEVREQKVLGDKVIFRGSTWLHILYRTQEGALASWDFEIPFSQYAELQEQYDTETQAQVMPLVTAMELDCMDGRLRLKAGLSGQYMIYKLCQIPVVEDAYSPDREVTVHTQELSVPAVSQRQSQRLRAEQTAPFGGSRVADVTFYPGFGHKQRKPQEVILELPGHFQVLYYDTEGVLQSGVTHWQEELSMELPEGSALDVVCGNSGKLQAVPTQESTMLRGEVLLDTGVYGMQQICTVTGLTVAEQSEKDPLRPSVILRKPGTKSLWELAKENGSTVQSIREANNLQQDPEKDQLLLIPVL